MSSKGFKYAKADDSIFLTRIEADTLRVDLATGYVYVRRSTRGKWRRLRPFRGGKQHAPYWFVRVYKDNARKAIALHRLVWMAANGRCVPEGFDVDHRDCDPDNNGIDNLRLRESGNNRGKRPMTDAELAAEYGEF